jgi:very-short-patch-repair endonuclease
MVMKCIKAGKIRGRESYPFYYGASPCLLRFAHTLRRSMTCSEKIVWEYLRNRKLHGFKFRRQHPINVFIVDFFCYELQLAVELDGSVHNSTYQKERDIERTKVLKGLGITVIRFTNDEVENNTERVLKLLRENIEEQKKILATSH